MRTGRKWRNASRKRSFGFLLSKGGGALLVEGRARGVAESVFLHAVLQIRIQGEIPPISVRCEIILANKRGAIIPSLEEDVKNGCFDLDCFIPIRSWLNTCLYAVFQSFQCRVILFLSAACIVTASKHYERVMDNATHATIIQLSIPLAANLMCRKRPDVALPPAYSSYPVRGKRFTIRSRGNPSGTCQTRPSCRARCTRQTQDRGSARRHRFHRSASGNSRSERAHAPSAEGFRR